MAVVRHEVQLSPAVWIWNRMNNDPTHISCCMLSYTTSYTCYIYIHQANWIVSSSSNCNQGLLDDSMQLQLIHTVHHSYHWLQKSQLPGHKWFLCCFNSTSIDGKDIFCVIAQYSELKFLRGNLHCVKLWAQSDTTILRSLTFLKRPLFSLSSVDETHWLRLIMKSRSSNNCKFQEIETNGECFSWNSGIEKWSILWKVG